jgi:hypothetical protein
MSIKNLWLNGENYPESTACKDDSAKKYKNIPKLVISWFDYLPDQLID